MYIMLTKEPTDKELKEAYEFINKLLSDEKKMEKWADKVMEGWLKRRKRYKRS